MTPVVAMDSQRWPWHEAVKSALGEVGEYALGGSAVTVGTAVDPQIADSLIGAHIPLVGSKYCFDLAIVSTPDGCKALGRSMLQMGASEAISEAEVADAVREISNMLGGTVKRRLSQFCDLELGLPVFIEGRVLRTDRMVVVAMPVKVGAVDAAVLIVGRMG
jgi:hypothetical protein